MDIIQVDRSFLGLNPIPIVITKHTCPHCKGCGRLYIGDDIEDCGVCCENGYITEDELKEYLSNE